MYLIKTNVSNLQKFKKLGWQCWYAVALADVIIRWIWKIGDNCQTQWLSNALTVKHINSQMHWMSNVSTQSMHSFDLMQSIWLSNTLTVKYINWQMHWLLNTSTVKRIKYQMRRLRWLALPSASAKNTRTEYLRLTFEC